MKDIFFDIRDNLTRAYIFYFPKQIYPHIEKTFLTTIIKPQHLNVVSYSNIDKVLVGSVSQINGLELFEKSTLLEENILTLIEQKKLLTEDDFNYLIDNYSEFVSIHKFLTDWMDSNVLNDIPDIKTETLSLFTLQANIFKKHLKTLEKQFGKKEAAFQNTHNILQKLTNDEILLEPEENEIIDAPKEIVKDIKSKEKTKRKKKPNLISEKESDNFILETVFNIDAKYLK